MVDWDLAGRTARAVSGGVGPIGRPGPQPPDRYRVDEVVAACERELERAAAYAGLGEVSSAPLAELVDRGEWTETALGTLAEAVGPLERRLADELGAAGPLAALARRLLGGAAGAEAGAAVGYAGRRVLGQYDVALFGPPRPPRLLFVGANLDAARAELGAERELFLSWVALHETTHVVQFERVPWLAGHIGALAGALIESAAEQTAAGARDLARRLIGDPRAVIRAALRGELARLLADPDQRRSFDSLQAAMSVIEGHAEHVMDSAAPDRPGLGELRAALDRRRARSGGLGDAVGRLLGFDLKLRQYALGKAFCDAVAARGGGATLRLLWASPDRLPTLAELEDPARWLARIGELSGQPA